MIIYYTKFTPGDMAFKERASCLSSESQLGTLHELQKKNLYQSHTAVKNDLIAAYPPLLFGLSFHKMDNRLAENQIVKAENDALKLLTRKSPMSWEQVVK